nr:FERM and PDZ domain-containing protein 1-like isoform X1 [Nerophis lumbriciformis]
MELQDRSHTPSRRASRVEQVVGRWLRRSRDLGSRSLSRDSVAVDGRTAESGSSADRNYPFRLNVLIQQDPNLKSHGLTLSSHTPILVEEITPGGPADGRLFPGDQLVKINNVAVDDLTSEQAAEIIRECEDTLSVTILRTMLGPKSSFITPEKRAKLKSNPVKVHFAEEVEVNGHAQGNSLLFLPNVLKVYLENGQTKAFKFEPITTVKDIVMTLKEKLSLRKIEHFSLVLEQQYSVTKLLLLHDEEKIQQVVQKKDAHDFRCLFRVCFIPKKPETLLQGDPTAFEYLYLQGVNDVLQERFAVEMRCNTALRLAAMHIQERLVSCGLPPKTNLKTVTKTWGIETFVSSTLLRNMREKDLKKAINFQLKSCQSESDPKQKGLTVHQARINYLEELSELKSFGGKSFSATMMLQDRESTVTLLVGARYGVSQVINHKLSILSTLTEFNSITRLELVHESDKVSLVKIYLQDIKPITLLLETVAAKDMSCLIAGYCRVFVDPTINIFPWMSGPKKHKVSVEEGYVSRCCSDSDNSSDLDMEPLVTRLPRDGKRARVRSSADVEGRHRPVKNVRKNKYDRENRNNICEDKRHKIENNADTEMDLSDRMKECKDEDKQLKQETEAQNCGRVEIDVTGQDCGKLEYEARESKTESAVTEDQASLSDSCHTDSCVITSPSSDSLDLLEEDNLIPCSSSSIHPSGSTPSHAQTFSSLELHPYTQTYSEDHRLVPPPAHFHRLLGLTSHSSNNEGGSTASDNGAEPRPLQPVSPFSDGHLPNYSTSSFSENGTICFAELSRVADLLPSPPEASEDEQEDMRRGTNMLTDNMDEVLRRICEGGNRSFQRDPHSPSLTSASSNSEFVFNFDQSDARCYYKLCSNITPDSACKLSQPVTDTRSGDKMEGEQAEAGRLQPLTILLPPPGFEDSSSDEEFFDARDGLTSPENPASGAVPKDDCGEIVSTLNLGDLRISVPDANTIKRQQGNKEVGSRKRYGSRYPFMKKDHTYKISYPEPNVASVQDLVCSRLSKNLMAESGSDHEPSEQTHNLSPTESYSLSYSEGEPAQLESKPILLTNGPHCLTNIVPGDQTEDPLAPTRNRKQEMEMEPDAMESKSVTEALETLNISINVVRCRVDPDGRESVDCRSDGKEEGGYQDGMKERKSEDETEPFVTLEGNTLAELNAKSVHLIAPVQNTQTKVCDLVPSSYSTPSPLPPKLVRLKLQSHSTGTSTKIFSFNSEEQVNSVNNSQLNLEMTSNEGEATDAVCSASNASGEVTESTNDDKALEADEVMNASIGKYVDTDDWRTLKNRSISVYPSTGSTSQMRSKCLKNTITENSTTISAQSEFAHTVNSITAKLGAAISDVSPQFNSGPVLETEGSNALCVAQTVHETREESYSGNYSLQTNTAMIYNLSKGSPSPTHFLFQSCSPSIMGRLSTSRLRGTIQKLPMFLSHSQEFLNQDGLENDAQRSVNNGIMHKMVDANDALQIKDTIEAVESDDSDTVTGSDQEGEFSVDTANNSNLVSEVTETREMLADDVTRSMPVQNEPQPQQRNAFLLLESNNTPGPITQPPGSIMVSLPGLTMDTPGPVKDAPRSKIEDIIPTEIIPSYKPRSQLACAPPQNLNGLEKMYGQSQKEQISDRPEQNMDSLRPLSSACGNPGVSSKEGTTLNLKHEIGCTSLLTSRCESVVEGLNKDACGCSTIYTDCFSREGSFDEEMTIYEFSCKGSSVTPSSRLAPLTTDASVSYFPTSSSAHPPSFPPAILFSPPTSELGPLLSPLIDACVHSQTQKDTINQLGNQRYPKPPIGFQVLCVDVDKLLSVLEKTGVDRSVDSLRGHHPRDTCASHFTENKQVLQTEARRLTTCCQKVVGIDQNPEKMLSSLADSFRTLVELAGICMWFSGCDRCERRNAEAVAGLVDVARSFRDLCLAAERAGSNRSCHDLSTKLLAKQCTALTASVFCLTQVFRTLTEL